MAKKENKTKEETKNEMVKVELAGTRGRVFEGFVVKKFPKRVVIEQERTFYIPKYERFSKKKTRIHARLPENIQVEVGDYIKVQECRPLSKIIHHKVIEKVSSANAEGGKK